MTVTEDLSKRWDFATASSGKVYCLRFKAFKDCQFQREIRFHNFHQNPREQAGASKVHEEHQEEQSRAWVSRQLTFFGQDPLFCLELRLLFVSIILLFVSIILVSREFLCTVRSSFSDACCFSGNVLTSPNPGASWSTTACMWIISATFGMMSLAREYEQIITRSKVSKKNDMKLQKVVEMSESERALDNKLPSRQV